MRPSRVNDLGSLTHNDRSVRELPWGQTARGDSDAYVILISSPTVAGSSVLKNAMSLILKGFISFMISRF